MERGYLDLNAFSILSKRVSMVITSALRATARIWREDWSRRRDPRKCKYLISVAIDNRRPRLDWRRRRHPHAGAGYD